MWFRVLYLTEWAIRLGMLLVVIRRNRPPFAIAWLMVIFLYPWVGIPLYFAFGSTRVSRRRKDLLQRVQDHLRQVRLRLATDTEAITGGLELDDEEIAVMVEKLGAFPACCGSSIGYIPSTLTFIDRLVEDIDDAAKSVNLLYYILRDDATGRRVVEALCRASKRGVRCRLLADAVGSRTFLKVNSDTLEACDVEIRRALPLRLLRRIRRRVDTRNHRKIAVIDGEIGYIGSHNLCEPDYGRRDLVWHDVSARVHGPIAAHLEGLFFTDWCAEARQMPSLDHVFGQTESVGNSWLHLLPSGPIYPRENYQRLIAAAIHRARRRVLMTTPYFVPDEAILQAIETACLRGVEIGIVLPAKADQRLPGFAAKSYYEEILNYGVRLYLYDKGLLHAKTVTVDDRMAFLGSGNVDIRSFALNFEATLVCYTTEDVERLSEIQKDYIAASRRLTAEEWDRRGASIRVIENIVRLLGPLL